MHRSILFIAGMLTTTAAFASPHAYRVTGSVTLINDPTLELGGQINLGDALYADYVYDPSTPDSNAAAEVGDYWHTTAPYGVYIHMGPWLLSTDPTNVNFLVEYVNDYYSLDNFVFHSYNNITAVGPTLDVDIISWQLDDPTMSALANTNPVPIDLAAWQSWFGIDISGTSGGIFGAPWMVRAEPVAIRPMPFLTATGSAPTTFSGTGYTPGRTVAVLTSPGVGSVMVPSGPCVGGHTGLSAPTLRRTFAADATGEFSVNASLPPVLSGQYVVVFDMTTCTASPAVRIP